MPFQRMTNTLLFVSFFIIYLFMAAPGPAWSADATNNVGDTITGNWDGTADNDNYDNQGTVTADVDMTQGGSDTVTNSGTVGSDILMSSDGSNTVTNTGTVSDGISGSNNASAGASGGSNTITNSGSGTAKDIYGSYSSGASSSGSSNIIDNSGTVNRGIYGSYSSGDSSSGGSNTITNSGTVDYIYSSYNSGASSSGGGNTTDNSGTITDSIFGSYNRGTSSSGGGNTINNSGTVSRHIFGTENYTLCSGGSNTITNSGTADYIYGNYNRGISSSGGNNTITNTGTVNQYLFGSHNAGTSSIGSDNTITNTGTVTQYISGSYNFGTSSIGGSNTINNSGTVSQLLGSYNFGASSSGGDNTITNTGTVGGSIYGSYNRGINSSSTGNTINNSGTVTGDIYGSHNTGAGSSGGNDTITNSGTVGGGIYGEDGDDRVNIESGSSVGGMVDGGTGTDTLAFNNFGSVNSSQYVNFENLIFYGSGDTTLTGIWNCGGYLTVESGSTFSLASSASLSVSRMDINSGGTAQIYGSTSVTGATTVDGSLNVNSGGSLGTASLDINSGGTMSVGGIATVSGDTNNAGSLNVNGTLNTASLTNSGTLSGSGTINGSVSNSGIISPGNSIGTLTVGGNFTNSGSGVLLVEVRPDGSHDQLRVTGSATLNGGTLRASLPRALYTDKQGWDVLTAGNGVRGSFSNVDGQPNSQTLNLHALTSANKVTLEVWRTPFASLGATPGQQGTGAGLDAIVPQAQASGDDMAALITMLDFDYSLSQIQNALEAMSPEMYAGFSAASLQAAKNFTASMTLRAESVRNANKLGLQQGTKGSGPVAAAADKTPGGQQVAQFQPTGGWSVWARTLGGWFNQSGTGGHLGYKLTSGGVVVGTDGPVLPWLRLGFSFGASSTDIGWSRGNYSGDQQGLHGGFFAAADLGDFYADLSLSYGSYENNGGRPMDFTNVSTKATSSFGGQSDVARLGGGYDFKAGGVVFGPTLAVNYLYVEEDDFNESGADFLSYNVKERSDDYFISSVGFKATTLWRSGKLSFLPRLLVAWDHNFNDDARAISASFRDYNSSSFTVTSIDPAADLITAQAGLDIRLSEAFSAYLDCGVSLGDNVTAQGVSVGLDLRF